MLKAWLKTLRVERSTERRNEPEPYKGSHVRSSRAKPCRASELAKVLMMDAQLAQGLCTYSLTVPSRTCSWIHIFSFLSANYIWGLALGWRFNSCLINSSCPSEFRSNWWSGLGFATVFAGQDCCDLGTRPAWQLTVRSFNTISQTVCSEFSSQHILTCRSDSLFEV